MTAPPLPPDVTHLLKQWNGGDTHALDDLMPLVYDELRRIAHRHMAGERADHTLQATALVNEAYLRMRQSHGTRLQGRAQFFAVAAQMMRHILVDYARRHARAKRGGGARPVTLDDAMAVTRDNASELLAIDEALRKLEVIDPRKSKVAVLRFFAGLTMEEAAEALDVSRETVARDTRFALAWLRKELSSAA